MNADNSFPIFVVVGEGGETQFININQIAQILVPAEAGALQLIMSHGARISLNLPDNRAEFMQFVAKNAFTANGESILTEHEKASQTRPSDGFQKKVNLDLPRR